MQVIWIEQFIILWWVFISETAPEVTRLFSVEQYAKKMLTEGAWGGGIELICFSRNYCVNVHVYRVNCRVICTVTNRHCDPPPPPRCAQVDMASEEFRYLMFTVLNAPPVSCYGMATITISYC